MAVLATPYPVSNGCWPKRAQASSTRRFRGCPVSPALGRARKGRSGAPAHCRSGVAAHPGDVGIAVRRTGWGASDNVQERRPRRRESAEAALRCEFDARAAPAGSKWSLMSTRLAARVKRRTVNTARDLSRPLIVHRDSLPVPVRSALRRAHRALPVRIRRALQYPPVVPVIGRLASAATGETGEGAAARRSCELRRPGLAVGTSCGTAPSRCRSRGVRLRQGLTRPRSTTAFPS